MVEVKRKTLKEVKEVLERVFDGIKREVTTDIINHTASTIPQAFAINGDFLDDVILEMTALGAVAVQDEDLFKSYFTKLNITQKAFFLIPYLEAVDKNYDKIITLLMTHHFKTKDKQFLAIVEILIDADDIYKTKTQKLEAIVRSVSDDALVDFIQLTTFALMRNVMDDLIEKMMEENREGE